MRRNRFLVQRGGIAVGVAMAAVMIVAGPEPVRAQDAEVTNVAAQSNPFSALVGKSRRRRDEPQQRVFREKYVLAGDDRSFLFEFSNKEARLKFLCLPDDSRIDCRIDPEKASPEIFVVAPVRGPRGDVIYKADSGATLLRIAAYGGATVYWPGELAGAAASKSFGEDVPLKLEPETAETVARRLSGASAFVSARTGSSIVFDAPVIKSESGDYSVLADSIVLAAKAVGTIAADETGAEILGRRLSRIRFVAGSEPDVQLNDDVLIISYVPGRDITGRLSSLSIVQFLENTL